MRTSSSGVCSPTSVARNPLGGRGSRNIIFYNYLLARLVLRGGQILGMGCI